MNPKLLVKSLLRSIMPGKLWLRLSAIRSRRYNNRYLQSIGCGSVNQKLLARFGPRTLAGHFPGLILPEMTHGTRIGPFLLGTYEAQIAPWLVSLKHRRFSEVLDVGSSFGYYAAGLATWYPDTPVIAFDTDPWAQKATREMARANNISNLLVKGCCHLSWMAKNMRDNALMICDCEGFEFTLLNPGSVPALRTATMIVESHDTHPWTKHGELIRQFQPTHRVLEATFDGQEPHPTVDIGFLSPDERWLAVGEGRTVGQKWLFFDPIG